MPLHAIYAAILPHPAASCGSRCVAAKEPNMDIAMVVLTLAFFALSFAYIRACDAL